MNKISPKYIVTPLLLLALAACGHDEDDHTHDNNAAANNNHTHNNSAANNSAANNSALVDYEAVVQSACDSVAATPAELTAGETLEAAVAVEIGTPTLVNRPAGGVGYITLTNTETHTTWLAFTDHGDVLKGLYAEGALQEPLAGLPNALCEADLGGQTTVHVHEPMTYAVEIESDEPVWLLVLLAEVGHDPTATEDDEHDHDHGK